jgi:hypothetical protein
MVDKSVCDCCTYLSIEAANELARRNASVRNRRCSRRTAAVAAAAAGERHGLARAADARRRRRLRVGERCSVGINRRRTGAVAVAIFDGRADDVVVQCDLRVHLTPVVTPKMSEMRTDVRGEDDT